MIETRIQQVDDITVVEMSGRLDLGDTLTEAENSINRLIDSGVRKMVIDVSDLDHIDSSGLGMLIFCSGRMEQSAGRMRVAGAGGPVLRILEVAHADRVLHLDPDLASSCRNLSADAAAG
jgi:anti-sigma B factor antagonist